MTKDSTNNVEVDGKNATNNHNNSTKQSYDIKNFKLDANRRFVKRLSKYPKNKDPDKQTISIGFRQVYVLPTLKGLYFLITLIILFLWAVNYGLNLGYLLVFFCLMLFMMMAVLTVKNLSNITITALINEPFFAGGEAFFNVNVVSYDFENKVSLIGIRNGLKSNISSVLSSRHTNLSTKKTNNKVKQKKATSIDQIAKLHIPLGKSVRGMHKLDYLKINTKYPMEMFNCWTWLNFNSYLLIYPQPKGDLALPAQLLQQGNELQQSNYSGTDDFMGLRDYQPGDNLRQIAWKKSLTGNNKLPVKQFADQTSNQTVLDFNSHVLQHLDVESRLSQLCQWILIADSKNLPYELRLPNKTFAMNTGLNHKNQCLKALACH